MRIKFESTGRSFDRFIEHVERKGVGHPDTLCDAIAERASQRYSEFCHATFGGVAHHWFDKVVLAGGESRITWGVGELILPYTVLFFGKVTRSVGSVKIPVLDILHSATCDVLDAGLVGFKREKHLRLEDRLVDYQGAGRLNTRYRPSNEAQLADLSNVSNFRSNDCNMVSAFAPLTAIEQMVLNIEDAITSGASRNRFPFVGTDVKVFAVRDRDSATVTVNVPFLADRTSSPQEYEHHKESLLIELRSRVAGHPFNSLEFVMNPQDRYGHPYLTALGSAADTGDVGLVGRGNRANGLITPMRPMSIEAPAGKNPTDHTGKIYAKLALDLAVDLHRALGSPVEVYIFTAKETLLSEPDEIVVLCDSIEQDAPHLAEQVVRSHLDRTRELVWSFVSPGVVLW